MLLAHENQAGCLQSMTFIINRSYLQEGGVLNYSSGIIHVVGWVMFKYFQCNMKQDYVLWSLLGLVCRG